MNNIESYFGAKLPETYKAFLNHHSNEYQNDLVILYLPDDIIERNETYETKEYAPGYIAIGDDSGGSAFLLKLEQQDPSVYVVSHGSMDPEIMEFVCNSFSEWVKKSCEYE